MDPRQRILMKGLALHALHMISSVASTCSREILGWGQQQQCRVCSWGLVRQTYEAGGGCSVRFVRAGDAVSGGGWAAAVGGAGPPGVANRVALQSAWTGAHWVATLPPAVGISEEAALVAHWAAV